MPFWIRNLATSVAAMILLYALFYAMNLLLPDTRVP